MESTEAVPSAPHSGAIEAYGIEPIPEALKTVRWPDLFLLVSNFLVNPGTILIGGLAVASGLSFWATILTSTLGILIAFSAYIVMATVGVDYGITGQVACRMVFGIQGAKWLPSIMRTIASGYWLSMAEDDLPLQPSRQSCGHRLSFLCIGPRPGRELSPHRGIPFSCTEWLGLSDGRGLVE
jgi:hypothetical protein